MAPEFPAPAVAPSTPAALPTWALVAQPPLLHLLSPVATLRCSALLVTPQAWHPRAQPALTSLLAGSIATPTVAPVVAHQPAAWLAHRLLSPAAASIATPMVASVVVRRPAAWPARRLLAAGQSPRSLALPSTWTLSADRRTS
jgi:hypothetical protein